MNIFKFRTVNSGYKSLVRKVLDSKDLQIVDFEGAGKGKFINKRSRRHLRNVHILFEKPEKFTQFKVSCPERTKVMNDYMEQETVLFDNGVIDSNEMGKISKIWKKIENPDQTINANYGYMVYHLRDAGNENYSDTFMSQWEFCQNRLVDNLYTLQAIMHFNRPKDQWIGNLDQPCTVFCQFTVETKPTGDHLNFHSFMRSNDIIYGTPYNLAYFVKLQSRMIKYLNTFHNKKLKFGYLHHNVTSLHLYEDKVDIAKSIVGKV